MSGEFDLIRRWFATGSGARAGFTPGERGVVLGIGDDAALLELPEGHELVAATDTVVAGVHFPHDCPPRAIGHRALAVNLSDLAAMGAEPRWALLALTLPEEDPRWLDEFAAGFHALADRSCCALVGGDTTRGPLAITVTALGSVPRGTALRRAGARVGDAVCVSGSLGDAAAGLRLFQGRYSTRTTGVHPLLLRFELPEPRLALGDALRGIATACIDVSDGLLADLGHVLEASGVGATVDADAVPISVPMELAIPAADHRELALAGGDDYELAFTCAPGAVDGLRARAVELGVQVTRIGTIEAAPGLRCRDRRGEAVHPLKLGYEHFRSS